jgi:hypothetical protein
MIAGQLGSAQLGAAQLGAYSQLDTPSGTPPIPGVITVGIIDASNLNYVRIPDYFKMMGICTH